MNCANFDGVVDDYLDKTLNIEDSSAFRQHVSGCADCSARLRRAESLVLALSKLAVPEPSPGFEQRILSTVRNRYQNQERAHGRLRFATGFATAAVAGLAIWFISTIYTPRPFLDQPQMISLGMNDVQTVRLVFDSHRDISQVRLSIDFPENVELNGYPGRKNLAWNTSLEKGQNVLALPVIAIEQGQGELVARLSYGQNIKMFRVLLATGNDGAMYYRLEEVRLS